MYKYIHVCVVCYICFVVIMLIDFGKANESANHRQRRYLSFKNMTHFFYSPLHLEHSMHSNGTYTISLVNTATRFENVGSTITNSLLRFNFKVNMVPWSQIFAQALGFRMNWDAPPDTFHPYRNHFIHRRAIYSHTETLLDKNGLNGFHCVRRAICEMETIPEPRKIYHKLLKMVFRQQSSATDKWHNKTTGDCEVSVSSCPFSFLDVSLYTDV